MKVMRDYQFDNLIAVSASFVIVLTVTLLVLRSWRRAFEARHELRSKLLEKLTPMRWWRDESSCAHESRPSSMTSRRAPGVSAIFAWPASS